MVATEQIRQLVEQVNAADLAVLLPGVTLLAVWLATTSLGRTSLAQAPARRNNMPLYLPFVPLVIWQGLSAVALMASEHFLAREPQWQKGLVDNLILLAGAAGAIWATLWLARNCFARRLKGFGLNPATIFKDLAMAAVNLATVWPIVIVMMLATMLLGRMIAGPDFEMPRHQELELLMQCRHPAVLLVTIIVTVAVGPAAEELIFRGLFQTAVRSFVAGLWPAVLVSSAMFAIVHADSLHWPTLFILSCCLGYAYEKSGSLFRPIFIHSIFNALGVVGVLYGNQ